MMIFTCMGIGSGFRETTVMIRYCSRHVLDLDFAVADAALQGIPGKGAGQHITGVDHQVAAVGPVQGARLDQGEIGAGDASHLHDMVDAAEQVVVGGFASYTTGAPHCSQLSTNRLTA
jgi:hypothetical protein